MRKKLVILLIPIISLFSYANKVTDDGITIINTAVIREDEEIAKLEAEKLEIDRKIKELEKRRLEKLEAQKNKELSVGLALSGGGAKGFAHVGVLKELEKRNIKIDYISGTSMGAIIGSLYAVGYSADEIEAIVTTIDWEDIIEDQASRSDIPLEKRLQKESQSLNISYDSGLEFHIPGGVRNGEKMYLLLKELYGIDSYNVDFDKLKIPLRVVATNLDTGLGKTFDHGDLAKVVSASYAIPTILNPVIIDGNPYVDGMLAKNLPTEDVLELGPDIVIAVDVGSDLQSRGEYSILTVLDQLLAIQSTQSTPEQIKLADIYMKPDLEGYTPLSFDSAEAIIKKGEEIGDAVLKEPETKVKLLGTKRTTKEVGPSSVGDLIIPKNKSLSTTSSQAIESGLMRGSYIEDLELKGDSFLTEDLVKSQLKKELPNYFSTEELNEVMLKIYALEFTDKVYYHVKDNTLIIDIDEQPTNNLELGFGYSSEFGANGIAAIQIHTPGAIGGVTDIEAKIGKYLGLGAKTSYSYGDGVRFGLNLDVNFEQTPLYIYEDEDRRSELVNDRFEVKGSATANLFGNLLLEAGTSFVYGNLNEEIGRERFTELEYDEEYNLSYIELKFDELDNGLYPTKGIRGSANYVWAGAGESSVDFYGPSYQLEAYHPVTDDVSISGTISGGNLEGSGLLPDEHFKLGGSNNNFDRKEFSFYGYNAHRKLVDEFLIGQLGIHYNPTIPPIYAIFKYNIGTFEGQFTSTKKMWSDSVHGFGATLGIKSPLGPFELSLMRDSDSRGFLWEFQVGYIF